MTDNQKIALCLEYCYKSA